MISRGEILFNFLFLKKLYVSLLNKFSKIIIIILLHIHTREEEREIQTSDIRFIKRNSQSIELPGRH
jgi:hypothetical protein